jgi:hypothetical protein
MTEWFRLRGGQCNPGSITIPFDYTGSVPLHGLEVTASGDHVEDVGDKAMIFDGLTADLGDVAPGDGVLIMVRTDGTPGPQTITLDFRAGEAARRLVVESSDSGRPQITEHPAPDRGRQRIPDGGT